MPTMRSNYRLLQFARLVRNAYNHTSLVRNVVTTEVEQCLVAGQKLTR